MLPWRSGLQVDALALGLSLLRMNVTLSRRRDFGVSLDLIVQAVSAMVMSTLTPRGEGPYVPRA
jgi:hypothetical protein